MPESLESTVERLAERTRGQPGPAGQRRVGLTDPHTLGLPPPAAYTFHRQGASPGLIVFGFATSIINQDKHFCLLKRRNSHHYSRI